MMLLILLTEQKILIHSLWPDVLTADAKALGVFTSTGVTGYKGIRVTIDVYKYTILYTLVLG